MIPKKDEFKEELSKNAKPLVVILAAIYMLQMGDKPWSNEERAREAFHRANVFVEFAKEFMK